MFVRLRQSGMLCLLVIESAYLNQSGLPNVPSSVSSSDIASLCTLTDIKNNQALVSSMALRPFQTNSVKVTIHTVGVDLCI